MGSDVFSPDAVRQFEGYLFDKAACVDEDQGGAVVLRMRGELVEYLVPHAGVGDRVEFIGRHFDGDIQLAALANLDDGGGLAIRVDPGEKIGYQLNRILSGREAD